MSLTRRVPVGCPKRRGRRSSPHCRREAAPAPGIRSDDEPDMIQPRVFRHPLQPFAHRRSIHESRLGSGPACFPGIVRRQDPGRHRHGGTRRPLDFDDPLHARRDPPCRASLTSAPTTGRSLRHSCPGHSLIHAGGNEGTRFSRVPVIWGRYRLVVLYTRGITDQGRPPRPGLRHHSWPTCDRVLTLRTMPGQRQSLAPPRHRESPSRCNSMTSEKSRDGA